MHVAVIAGVITYYANLTDNDTHVSFNKIISLQDKFTFKPNVTRKMSY